MGTFQDEYWNMVKQLKDLEKDYKKRPLNDETKKALGEQISVIKRNIKGAEEYVMETEEMAYQIIGLKRKIDNDTRCLAELDEIFKNYHVGKFSENDSLESLMTKRQQRERIKKLLSRMDDERDYKNESDKELIEAYNGFKVKNEDDKKKLEELSNKLEEHRVKVNKDKDGEKGYGGETEEEKSKSEEDSGKKEEKPKTGKNSGKDEEENEKKEKEKNEKKAKKKDLEERLEGVKKRIEELRKEIEDLERDLGKASTQEEKERISKLIEDKRKKIGKLESICKGYIGQIKKIDYEIKKEETQEKNEHNDNGHDEKKQEDEVQTNKGANSKNGALQGDISTGTYSSAGTGGVSKGAPIGVSGSTGGSLGGASNPKNPTDEIEEDIGGDNGKTLGERLSGLLSKKNTGEEKQESDTEILQEEKIEYDLASQYARFPHAKVEGKYFYHTVRKGDELLYIKEPLENMKCTEKELLKKIREVQKEYKERDFVRNKHEGEVMQQLQDEKDNFLTKDPRLILANHLGASFGVERELRILKMMCGLESSILTKEVVDAFYGGMQEKSFNPGIRFEGKKLVFTDYNETSEEFKEMLEAIKEKDKEARKGEDKSKELTDNTNKPKGEKVENDDNGVENDKKDPGEGVRSSKRDGQGLPAKHERRGDDDIGGR